MSFEMEKAKIAEELEEAKGMLAGFETEKITQQIRELITDIQNDFNTVVVVGEFKHGKSTFINSLLGESLLPVDVTPTTATINAIMWGEEERLSVHKSDGTIERCPLTKEALGEYVAGKDFNPDSIDYLKLQLPKPLLSGNRKLVIVDTPGVNDLNSHRSEITYKFIPKADVVLFLLDLTTPVRKTEKEFIEEALLEEGLDRIIFLANFLDQIDEDEVDVTLDFARNRLIDILPGRDVKLYPLSAQTAVDAIEDEDEELLAWSGLTDIQRAIDDELAFGEQTGIRLKRYKHRANKLYRAIVKDIDQKRALRMQSMDDLHQSLSLIQENLADKEKNEAKIHFYVDDRLDEFLYMINKSLNTFSKNLQEDIEEMIQTYKSADFKEFIEVQLPVYVKKKCKQWIEEHIEQINGLLFKLEGSLAKGLSREFNKNVQLHVDQNPLLKMSGGNFEITADDLSNTSILAGVIAGGAGALMMVVGGPILLPLVSMAGFPILQKKLMEARLEKAKVLLSSEIGPAIDQVLSSFRDEIIRYVKEYTQYIEMEATRLFDEELQLLKRNIETTIQDRQKTKKDVEMELARLDTLKDSIERLQEDAVIIGGAM